MSDTNDPNASTNDATTNATILGGDITPQLMKPNCRIYDETSEAESTSENKRCSKPKDDAAHDPKMEFKRYGWLPFYRTWTDEAWFQVHPWSAANLFIWLYCKANRVERHNAYKKKMVRIDRGCTATSITALAERSGLDPKTIRRMIRNLEEAGELKLEKCGADGIILRIVKYDDYAYETKADAQNRANDGRAEK